MDTTFQAEAPGRGDRLSRASARFLVLASCLFGCWLGFASSPKYGVLVHLNPAVVARFDARHGTQAKRLNPRRDLYLVTSNDTRTDQELLSEIETDPDAGRATLNVTVRLNGGESTASVLALDDPDPPTAPALDQDAAPGLNTSLVDYYGARAPSLYVNQPVVGQIKAGAQAHALATGRRAVVALIDNGVDQFNPVLSAVLLGSRGFNFFDNSPNWSAYADLAGASASGSSRPRSAAALHEYQSAASGMNGDPNAALALQALSKILAEDPDFGHGTSVAGLIHLVAPEAKILPIKAFGPDGTAEASAIYQSVTYAIDQHVDVLNLSFSSSDTTADIRDAIQEAIDDGIVVAAAAGNSDASMAVYPASLPAVIGVGALDGSGANPVFERADFSNFDPSAAIVDADVAAPGVQLWTTYPGFGLVWATVSGTSFSTPLVAGEAALLVQLQQTGAANRNQIENSADMVVAGDAEGEMGHGMVQVLTALQGAIGAPTPPAPGR